MERGTLKERIVRRTEVEKRLKNKENGLENAAHRWRKGKRERERERNRKAIKKTREHGGLGGYRSKMAACAADNRAGNGGKKKKGNFIRGMNTNWRQRAYSPAAITAAAAALFEKLAA